MATWLPFRPLVASPRISDEMRQDWEANREALMALWRSGKSPVLDLSEFGLNVRWLPWLGVCGSRNTLPWAAVGWDEILTPGMPNNIVIQSWRGPESLATAAKQGYRGLLSNGYYIDLMWSAARHYTIDPISGATADLTPPCGRNTWDPRPFGRCGPPGKRPSSSDPLNRTVCDIPSLVRHVCFWGVKRTPSDR
jgi:hypothetical protein